MEAQRAATENATRMTNAAYHYALSVNRAWIDLWDSRVDDYLELPKRFVDAQTDFIERAFDHDQERCKCSAVSRQKPRATPNPL